MSPGTHVPARQRGVRRRQAEGWRTPRSGGSTFAERPDLEVPDARIIWHADLDPGTLRVIAIPATSDDPDRIEPAMLSPWLTIVSDADGFEHAVLSDGWHRIRLDLAAGSLVSGEPVVLHYQLKGVPSALPKILPLRRLLDLCRHRRFAASLFPDDRRIERSLELLRVHDALTDGATQREIARALFGEDRANQDWRGTSDSLRSRVRRLVRDAATMAHGGYRFLMRGARERDGDHS